MGRCCGGKNAGKPISPSRFHVGRGIFLAYHAVVQAALLLAAVPSPRIRQLARFHRRYTMEIFGQIERREGIKLVEPTR